MTVAQLKKQVKGLEAKLDQAVKQVKGLKDANERELQQRDEVLDKLEKKWTTAVTERDKALDELDSFEEVEGDEEEAAEGGVSPRELLAGAVKAVADRMRDIGGVPVPSDVLQALTDVVEAELPKPEQEEFEENE